MKLSYEDNTKLKAALAACQMAGIDLAVIMDKQIRGMNAGRSAMILSPIDLSFDSDVKWGVTRLADLYKRMSLFESFVIEGDLNSDKKVKKVTIKDGKSSSKVEFRCTDISLLDRKYPKERTPNPMAFLIFKKSEISMLSKGIKTLGSPSQLKILVRRDGTVEVESADSSNDKFDFQLENQANFIGEPASNVYAYDISSSGVILKLLEHMASVAVTDNIQVTIDYSGIVVTKIYGHDVLAIPHIE